ncbi:hypothetical protein IL992_20800 [Microbispora sp. NEAU-D428]|uniref:hypothetical protein n=1 Tax=Microbispora sitophila TaxID=2771537 RepID=UPI0018684F58|nr:hypothetical protein [Microbispora sitophila]MBE3011622.1 hypothetical protein [Microbispora sitophila]
MTPGRVDEAGAERADALDEFGRFVHLERDAEPRDPYFRRGTAGFGQMLWRTCCSVQPCLCGSSSAEAVLNR